VRFSANGNLVFEGDTWEAYEKLGIDNKKLHIKLCKLIKEILRGDLATCTGKPELLKHQYQGLWSRRISAADRVIYHFDDDSVYLFAINM